jgi:hypothetical protein
MKEKAGKRGNPKWVKGGKSPNPTGRPKDGESWASIIKAVGDMYPSDLIAFIGVDNDLGRMLKQLPQNVQMKYLVTARVFSSLLFEPSHGLWKELMERAEGKVQQNVAMEIHANGIGVRYVDYRNGIAQTTPRPDGDSEASGEDEGTGDGEKVG